MGKLGSAGVESVKWIVESCGELGSARVESVILNECMNRDIIARILGVEGSSPEITIFVDMKIDQLVYGLYGLTAEEIKIMEGGE
ncbi:hypothetical protein AGMMS49938_14740 [Fibrobacterales bacterium]|nr:hypothetical protein AGMMS49938_14620 [Fibrobacterales bacterium]GHV15730.1 hypothetical protein AGMMS49938_14740 [Fibrobacterales bacterium]